MRFGPGGSRSWLVAVAIGSLVVALDQLTKHWALSALADGRTIDLFWTLRFNLAFNTGTAFSLGSDLGPIIALVAAGFIVALLASTHRVPSVPGLVGIGLVAGGAAGNLTDRAFRAGDGFFGGAVVDFIDLQWWPVFNIADMAIVSGAALLLFATWRADEPLPSEGRSSIDAQATADPAATDESND